MKGILNNLCRFFLVTSMFTFTSCGDIFSPNKETFYLDSESKEWLFDGEEGDQYIMKDSLNSREIVTLDEQWNYFVESTSHSVNSRLKDRMIYECESSGQQFSSDEGLELSVSLRAQEIPGIIDLEIGINDLELEYDLLNRKISRIGIWRQMDGNSSEGKFIDGFRSMSTVVFSDSITINGHTYADALEFTLMDIEDWRTENTVVGFAIAKGEGLLRYSLNNGQVFEKQVSAN
jgi:hypothetical protein